MEAILRDFVAIATLRSPLIEVQVRCDLSLIKYGTGIKYGSGARYGQLDYPKLVIDVELYERAEG